MTLAFLRYSHTFDSPAAYSLFKKIFIDYSESDTPILTETPQEETSGGTPKPLPPPLLSQDKIFGTTNVTCLYPALFQWSRTSYQPAPQITKRTRYPSITTCPNGIVPNILAIYFIFVLKIRKSTFLELVFFRESRQKCHQIFSEIPSQDIYFNGTQSRRKK